jgi:hypothetical protein
MIAPMIITQEPPKIEPRRPNLSLTIGMKGRDRMAPREYAAEIIPFSDP